MDDDRHRQSFLSNDNGDCRRQSRRRNRKEDRGVHVLCLLSGLCRLGPDPALADVVVVIVAQASVGIDLGLSDFTLA